MRKIINYLSYISTILLILYLLLLNGWSLYWYSLGGKIFVWHYFFPTEYNEVIIYPLILTEFYILLSGIYFIKMGYRRFLKND